MAHSIHLVLKLSTACNCNNDRSRTAYFSTFLLPSMEFFPCLPLLSKWFLKDGCSRGATKWRLMRRLIPHNISVNDPIGPVECFCAISCNEIVRRVFCKLCWKGFPEEWRLPFSFLENFHYLLHHYFASLSWQMNPISAKCENKVASNYNKKKNQPKRRLPTSFGFKTRSILQTGKWKFRFLNQIWRNVNYNQYSKWQWKRTYVKQTFIQSSLFWMAVKRSTTFTSISWHNFIHAWAYALHNSFVLTSSLRNLLLNHKRTILKENTK